MYQPTVGRWLSRDPIGVQGQPEIVYSHEYVANRLRGQLRAVSPVTTPPRFSGPNVNLYAYVDNSPVSFVDPSGMLQVRCPPVGARPPKTVTCRLRACATSIPAVPGARHLLIVLERTIPKRGKVEWAYRCGPSGKGREQKHCCKKKFGKHGQLVCTDAEYKKGFRDWVPKGKEDCERFDIKIVGPGSCETVHRCLQRVLKVIEKCCIDYTPVPLLLGSACNSNCAVKWMLDLCFKGGPKLFIKGRKPGFAPGFEIPPRKCVRDEFRGPKKKGDRKDDEM